MDILIYTIIILVIARIVWSLITPKKRTQPPPSWTLGQKHSQKYMQQVKDQIQHNTDIVKESAYDRIRRQHDEEDK